jgi:hypothetical protein
MPANPMGMMPMPNFNMPPMGDNKDNTMFYPTMFDQQQMIY